MSTEKAQELLLELLRENADPHSTMEGVLNRRYVVAILRVLQPILRQRRGLGKTPTR